jgi:2,5-dioxopentanoate dehydrogenase
MNAGEGGAAVDSLLEAAATAFRDGALERSEDRVRLLRLVAQRLAPQQDSLVTLVADETGIARARLEGEFQRTLYQLELFAQIAETRAAADVVIAGSDPAARPSPRPDLRRMNVAVGPVAVFAASNVPLAFGVAGGDTAAAWAAGCPVIAKSHPAQPATSQEVAGLVTRAVHDLRLHHGVFGHLAAADVDVAQYLVAHDGLRAVAFTGSLRAGRALFDVASSRPRPIPVYAEMGSANPFVVTGSALAARGQEIAAGLAESVLAASGQLCTKPNVAFIPDGAAGDAFVESFSRYLSQPDVGRMLTAGHCAAFASQVENLAGIDGVAVLVHDVSTGPAVASQFAVATTAGVAAENPALLEEHFGPGIVIIRYSSADQVIRILRLMGPQLTASIHAEHDDAALVSGLVPAMRDLAGRIVFNGYPTGVALSEAMWHGGPYPATTSAQFSAVGPHSIARFLRPVCFQNAPDWALPPELQDSNPLGLAQQRHGRSEPAAAPR